jgi:hypothetical protein
MTSRFALAKDHAVLSIDSIIVELFGGGRQQTHRYPGRWAVTNKWRAGASMDQMTVWRDGGRRGAWKDFVSGEKGDAIDLVAYGLTGIVTADTRMTALDWLEDRFGLKTMDAAAKAELEEKARARQAQLAEQDKTRVGADRDRARKFFFSCQPEILGTPVATYLMSRGIDLDAVPHRTTALRIRPDCGYWMGAQRDGEGNKLGRDPEFPAMIAAMVSGDGTLGACHYTFLEPDGSSKLKTGDRGYVDRDSGKPHSAKLMFPASGGLTIPVTYGLSGLKVQDAAQRGATGWMGFTEGIEDALSVAVTNGELRMHAAGSLAHLGALSDCPAAKGYLIFKDNDWGKPQAQAQFDLAIARLKSFGKPVETLAMPKAWGKDVNDALNHEERQDG